MRNYRKGSHSKYDLKVHLVWIPKYRKRITILKLREYIRKYLKEICMEEEIEIISGKLAIDHVHLFVSYPPTLSVSNMMKKLKGKSSYKLLKNHKDLTKEFRGRHFWARGYLAVSSGNITDEMVQEHIENQEGDDLQGEIDLVL